jgi:hypothetical protein
LIGKLHKVERVVMISSPPDGCFDATGLPLSLQPGCAPYGQPAAWVTPGVTPADNYYGLANAFEFAIKPMLANWGTKFDVSAQQWMHVSGQLGLFQFGVPVAPEASAPPYGYTHMLVTSAQLNPGTFPEVMSLQDHRLTARDAYVEKLDVQYPAEAAALRQAWRYISSR